MDPPPPPHSSYTSFPILAISLLGILTTAILLLSYYIFVIKCCHYRSNLLHLSTVRSPSPSHPHPPLFPSNQPPLGLSLSSIRSIPTHRFTHITGPPHVECSVCLTDFQDSDLLRLLPTCSHPFHIDCIDTWLQSNPNCPLCRTHISNIPIIINNNNNVNIIDTAPKKEEEEEEEIRKKKKKLCHVASMGDECIIEVREKDVVQPIRRSFSMDSSADRHLYVSVQRSLMFFGEAGADGSSSSSSSGSTGRVRRSFFSFGHGRTLRNAVLPVHTDV